MSVSGRASLAVLNVAVATVETSPLPPRRLPFPPAGVTVAKVDASKDTVSATLGARSAVLPVTVWTVRTGKWISPWALGNLRRQGRRE